MQYLESDELLGIHISECHRESGAAREVQIGHTPEQLTRLTRKHLVRQFAVHCSPAHREERRLVIIIHNYPTRGGRAYSSPGSSMSSPAIVSIWSSNSLTAEYLCVIGTAAA
jgi:hypothetical protein